MLTNVSIRVEEAGGPEAFRVMGAANCSWRFSSRPRDAKDESMVGKPEILTKTEV